MSQAAGQALEHASVRQSCPAFPAASPHKHVDRDMLHVVAWDGTTYQWLWKRFDVDAAHDAAFDYSSYLWLSPTVRSVVLPKELLDGSHRQE